MISRLRCRLWMISPSDLPRGELATEIFWEIPAVGKPVYTDRDYQLTAIYRRPQGHDVLSHPAILLSRRKAGPFPA